MPKTSKKIYQGNQLPNFKSQDLLYSFGNLSAKHIPINYTLHPTKSKIIFYKVGFYMLLLALQK